MTTLGPGILVRGEVLVADDLRIEGRVEGPVWCDGRAVTIAANGTLAGNVVARDITVFGRVEGTLVASEVVDIRPEAKVSGRVLAARFILTEGASFTGSAEPQHLEAALRVARHRRGASHETDLAPRQVAPQRLPAPPGPGRVAHREPWRPVS